MLIFALTALLVLLTDQISKFIIEHKPEEYFPRRPLPGLLIDRLHNYGLMLHLLQKWRWLPRVIPLLVLLLFLLVCLPFLLGMDRSSVSCATGLLLGGALGNILDRYTHGYVVDWFRLSFLPGKKLKRLVFNIADMAIFAAALWLLISLW